MRLPLVRHWSIERGLDKKHETLGGLVLVGGVFLVELRDDDSDLVHAVHDRDQSDGDGDEKEAGRFSVHAC